MPEPEFTLLGDAVWLDFVNTARGRTPSTSDLLTDATAYCRWARAQHLDPDAGRTPFDEVRRFRDRLTELAEALHAGRRPPAGAIAAINERLTRCQGCHQLTRVGGAWRLRFAPAEPPSALDAIARSAAASLADPAVRVRRCAGQGCSLFFTDTSLHGSRRWCNPEVCGRHARVERRRGLAR